MWSADRDSKYRSNYDPLPHVVGVIQLSEVDLDADVRISTTSHGPLFHTAMNYGQEITETGRRLNAQGYIKH